MSSTENGHICVLPFLGYICSYSFFPRVKILEGHVSPQNWSSGNDILHARRGGGLDEEQ